MDASLEDRRSWASGIAATAVSLVPESCGARARLDGVEALHGEPTPNRIEVELEEASITVFLDPAFESGPEERPSLTLLQVVMLENQVHARRGSVERTPMAPGGPEVWRALVCGELTVLREDGGLVLVPAPPASRVRRILTPLEGQILAAIAGGAQNKQVAATLRCSVGTVSRAAVHAAAKLGLTRVEALRVHATLAGKPIVAASPTLTETERDVLGLVCQGLSNEAIARARHRSPRTVANQISSLLRKTRLPSRRALAATRWACPSDCRG